MKQLKDLNKLTYWIFFMLVGIFVLSFFTSCEPADKYKFELTYKVHYGTDSIAVKQYEKETFCDCNIPELKGRHNIYKISYTDISSSFPLEIVDYKYTKIEQDGR